MEKLYDELRKKKNKHIFDLLYERSFEDQSWFIQFWPKYDYKNDYQKKQINFDDERHKNVIMQEFVFICVTKQNSRDVLDAWYISKEYNMAAGDNYSGDYIADRFVFKLVQENLQLVTLAEESAEIVMHAGFNIHQHYADLKKENELGKGNVLNYV